MVCNLNYLLINMLCVANPQAARNDEVLGALYNRIPPMPEQYMEEILDESGSYSPLDELIGNAAADLHLVRTVGDDIIRMYLADTANTWSNDSLTSFLSRRPGLEDRYVYALHCLRNGQTDSAQTLLEDIPSMFTLEEREQIEYESYVDVFDILADISVNEIQPGDLSTTQTEDLLLMLESEGTVEKSLAISLLKWNNPDLEYNEPILEPIYYQARKAKPGSLLDQTKLRLTLFPNPAYDYVTVRYNLPNTSNQSMAIVVNDALGRETINKPLQSASGELMLDLHHLAKGTYTVCLKEGKLIRANQKLIVIK